MRPSRASFKSCRQEPFLRVRGQSPGERREVRGAEPPGGGFGMAAASPSPGSASPPFRPGVLGPQVFDTCSVASTPEPCKEGSNKTPELLHEEKIWPHWESKATPCDNMQSYGKIEGWGLLRVSIACEIESERGAAIGNAKTDRDYSTVRDRAPGSTVEKLA